MELVRVWGNGEILGKLYNSFSLPFVAVGADKPSRFVKAHTGGGTAVVLYGRPCLGKTPEADRVQGYGDGN